MNILELDSYNLADAVKFNKELNPKIWQGQAMRPEVREKLLAIAEDFKQFLGLNDIAVKDITVSGSNANYSYTPYSDIDLHLVVDLPEADRNEVYRELFDAKKYQYNDQHNFKIGDYDVELYVENANKPPVSKGVYSVLNNDWINIPKKIRSTVDDDAVRSKYEDLKHRIEQAVKSNDGTVITRLAEKIKMMRQAGLDAHGELGSENLAYKMLRSQGFIQQLYDARNAAKDRALSLKEKAIKPKFTYGFTKEDASLTWDGVNPTTCMFLNEEDPEPTDEEVLKDFIDFCCKELKIEELPIIKLRRDPQWPVVHKTFGRYINEKNILEVAFGQRHIMDVLRTVAHELTHRHQHERDGEKMDHTAGETGSPWENEANARAGILMRDYGRLHPELFDTGEAEDLKVDEGVKSNAAAAAIVAALSGTPAPAQAQVQDIIGAVRDIGSLVVAAQKITRAGLNAEAQNEINTYLAAMRGQPDAQGISGLYKLQRQLQNQISEPLPGYTQQAEPTNESASGYIPTKKQAKDPRFSMALTQDIKPGQLGKEANKLNLKTDKQGHPQIAKASGLVEALALQLEQFKKKSTITESEVLDEVRMSPSNLMQWATSPEAQGIRAGFEAELIFRDTAGDDDDEGDMEPDYDMDERAVSIQQVMDFFENDEYGYGVYGREAEKLQEGLDEKYYEWQDEQMYNAFRDEAEDLIKKIIVEDDWNWDDEVRKQLAMMELSDDEIEEAMKDGENVGTFDSSKEQEAFAEENPGYQRYLEAYEQAEGLLDDLVEDSLSSQDKNYDAALDDFRDNFYVDDDSSFFGDVGLRWMSDIAETYNLTWPYITGTGGNNGSRDWESIGDSLTSAIDMPVKVSSGYHQATRKEGLWIVEPDSSLQPDDSDDMGLEIVSPPMPLLTALEKLQEVTNWANSNEGNAYTNSSTGLHMGVSVPYKGGDVDYLKLILFLGDEYVLQQFGREANTYTKSAMSKFRENIKGGRADPMGVIKLMQSGLLELAHKEIQKGVGDGKYTSAHIQDGYIEFRSAGGDWLAEENADPEKLSSTMLRYARAMQIAADPSTERREYAKKLYKLVAPEGDTQLALFSQYASGELTAEQLKQRWAEKAIGTEKKMNQRFRLYQTVDGRWEPVPGAEWNGYPESEVKNKVWAKYGREALDSGEYQLVNMGEQDWEVYDVKTGKTLEIVKGKSKGEVADAVYDKYVDQGIGFQVRPYTDPATLTPRAKLAKTIATRPTGPQVYTYYKWNVKNPKTGENDNDYMTRERVFQTTKKVEKENPRLGKYTNTIVGGGSAQLTSSQELRDIEKMTFDFRAKGSTDVIEQQTYDREAAKACPVVVAIERANELSKKLGKPVVAYEIQPQQATKEPSVQDTDINVAQNFADDRGEWEFYRTETGNVIDRVNDASESQAEAVRRDIVRRYSHPDTSVGMRRVN